MVIGPRTVWWLFATGTAAVLAMVGLLSIQIVTFEHRHRHDQAERENRRRADLALWRLEAQLAPILATENTRPYFHYRPQFPARDPYRLYIDRQSVPATEELQASPLAGPLTAFLLSHFEFGPDKKFQCPSPPAPQAVESAWGAKNVTTLFACALPPPVSAGDQSWADALAAAGKGTRPVAREWQIRAWSRQEQAIAQKTGTAPSPEEIRIVEGVMSPTWIGDKLLLLRTVDIGGRVWLQGAQLDWLALRPWLLDGIHDLLPNATLQPLLPGESLDAASRLAALPLVLTPGDDAAGATPSAGARYWLAFTWQNCPLLLPLWAGFLVLLLASGMVLRAMISLDQRRAAFVSAVTHELRTPLTTFRMVVEMQRTGMISKPQQLDKYMTILDEESGRLVHLVENVLAYAKLEQHRAEDRMRQNTVSEICDKILPRLQEHTARQELSLSAAIDPTCSGLLLRTDPAAVEQILFNLVDNACKYGRSEHTPAIQLEVGRTDRAVTFSVVDFGPGVPDSFRKRLFEPFTRAGEAASGEAPGVGLGLALCRRLAKSLGGELRHSTPATGGSRFTLTLPLAAVTGL